MVHAINTARVGRGDVRAIARQAASSPENAQAIAALLDLVDAVVRTRRAATTSSPGTAVLITLAKLGPVRVSELAAHLQLDQSTVSRHLANLDEAGLTSRTSDPTDRRAQIAGLTPDGWTHVGEAVTSRVQLMERVLDDWPTADRQELARLLSRFTDRFEHLTEGHRP